MLQILLGDRFRGALERKLLTDCFNFFSNESEARSLMENEGGNVFEV